MVQRFRSRPDHPGNVIAEIIDGIGARGSTISDIDQLTIVHDGGNGRPRFLFQELKNPEEQIDKSRRWMMRDPAGRPGSTSRPVRLRDDRRLTIVDYPHEIGRVLTRQEYRDEIAIWWGHAIDSECPHGNIRTECDWCWAESR
jgi:hypothetical protein